MYSPGSTMNTRGRRSMRPVCHSLSCHRARRPTLCVSGRSPLFRVLPHVVLHVVGSALPRRLQAQQGAALNAQQSGTHFLILSAQRSGTTGLVSFLSHQRGVTCDKESVRNWHSHHYGRNLSVLMLKHWQGTKCMRACGFDVFDGPAFLPDGRVHWKYNELFAGTRPPRAIIFERRDVRARYESWRRAMQTDNWSSGPLQHVNCSDASDVRAHPGVSCHRWASGSRNGRQCISDGSCLESFNTFKSKNDAWFARMRTLAAERSSAWLHVYSEDWFAQQDATSKRILAFLPWPSHRAVQSQRLLVASAGVGRGGQQAEVREGGL